MTEGALNTALPERSTRITSRVVDPLSAATVKYQLPPDENIRVTLEPDAMSDSSKRRSGVVESRLVMDVRYPKPSANWPGRRRVLVRQQSHQGP